MIDKKEEAEIKAIVKASVTERVGLHTKRHELIAAKIKIDRSNAEFQKMKKKVAQLEAKLEESRKELVQTEAEIASYKLDIVKQVELRAEIEADKD